MPIRIDNPLEVGADRLVNSIAAYERFGEACVVVDFGTGINIDAVSAEGEYLGGAIGPGLEISLTRADRPRRPHHPHRPRGARGGDRPLQPRRDPVRLRLRLRRHDRRHRAADRRGAAGARCCSPPVASPTTIVPFTETIDEVDDMLTLKGLRLIHERNTPDSPR